jgi:hypothetical protein
VGILLGLLSLFLLAFSIYFAGIALLCGVGSQWSMQYFFAGALNLESPLEFCLR